MKIKFLIYLFLLSSSFFSCTNNQKFDECSSLREAKEDARNRGVPLLNMINCAEHPNHCICKLANE